MQGHDSEETRPDGVAEGALFPELAAGAQAGDAAAAAGPFVEVALDLPLHREFSYRLPPGMRARPGNRVRVPFRGRMLPGVVVRVVDDPPAGVDPAKIRDVASVLDEHLLLPDAIRELAAAMARTYGCSLGEALNAMLPAAAKQRGVRKLPHLALALPPADAAEKVAELEESHQQQSRVLRAVLEFGGPMPVLDARRQTGTSDSPWKTLVKHGLLRRVLVDEIAEELVPEHGEVVRRHELNPWQAAAVEKIGAAVEAHEHRVFLLHGVTGSGKTEVYLHALEKVRAAGRTAIVLVPEISLTPQTVGRFAARFAGEVAVLHSGLTQAQRGKQWQELMNGRAAIAIGARSALFAPLSDLGLIVVDEEHETSFKQESRPRYHAREMAVERGRLENAPVILGSATPSLESYGKGKRGIYELLTLPERAGAGRMPKIVVTDLRQEEKQQRVAGVTLSRTLEVLMEERLRAKDQVILFLNRRGFAPVLLCPTCGSVVQCDDCDLSMTFHQRRGRLVCHACCAEKRKPTACPTCAAPKLTELGVGTERVVTAVQHRFPEAVVARMDADTMNTRGAHERVLGDFRARRIDVLVGTQMIAKGHDFPDVTLVGVISADTGLFVPDYRAAERTFQLLSQVAGRAGRGEKAGTVVIQTHAPDNYAIRSAAALDYEDFVQRELVYRKQTGYPPFSRLIRVIFESKREGEAIAAGRAARQRGEGLAGVETLGPAPCVMARVKERYRHHVLLKCATPAAFDAAMAELADIEETATHHLRVLLDVDPGSLL